MPRAERPSTPFDDLVARKAWTGPATGVLTPDLATFCQSGVSIVVASRGPDGRPLDGMALACRVVASDMIRLLLPRPMNEAFLRAIGHGAGIAATFSQPSTHRSIQLKGPGARIEAVTAEDERALARQGAVFRQELVDVGYPASWAMVYCACDRRDLAALAFEPTDAFVQTPGPGAGSALKP